MSQAIASARNRRAFNTPSTAVPGSAPAPSSQGQVQPNVNTQGLTLPQVIALVDKRLITLETFMKETNAQSASASGDNIKLTASIPIPEILDEFNSRFEILAQELETIKDVVLKLQSYTMEVNKMLVDERVHVFLNLGIIVRILLETKTDPLPSTAILLSTTPHKENPPAWTSAGL
jgi:hypothetical protein